MNIKILVASHKKYQMPKDSIYFPMQVGAEGKDDIGFNKDNTGDNISTKNPLFCELTGLYWAWKNLDLDYYGLVHYRRYFTLSKKIPKYENDKFNVVLSSEEVENLLKDTDIILPKERNYFIETVYNHYKHTMYIEPLDEAGKIIEEKYPEYLKEFENLKKTKKLHAFNMFIMKKEYFNEYCTWLFDILFELEKRIFGRVSERLLDVWIKTKGYSYKEVKVMDMQNINWFKKGSSFLIAKFTNKRYEKSF